MKQREPDKQKDMHRMCAGHNSFDPLCNCFVDEPLETICITWTSFSEYLTFLKSFAAVEKFCCFQSYTGS